MVTLDYVKDNAAIADTLILRRSVAQTSHSAHPRHLMSF